MLAVALLRVTMERSIMRRSICWGGTVCTTVLLVCLPHNAMAQKVGDKIVVIQDNVDVKVGNSVVDTVSRGMVFVVREDRGDRIEISNSTPGTIEKRHVIPLN